MMKNEVLYYRSYNPETGIVTFLQHVEAFGNPSGYEYLTKEEHDKRKEEYKKMDAEADRKYQEYLER